MEVPPADSAIWVTELSVLPTVATSVSLTVTPSSQSTQSSQEKDRHGKRGELEFTTLPHSWDTRMSFHDSAFISLACCEWETHDDSHPLENKGTTPALKELSGDLFFSLSRGTASNGVAATEAFPFLKDPMCVNEGIECCWSVFQQCCPLANHAVPKLLCEFNCLLQRSQESPRAFQSRINAHHGWLPQANFPISERHCVPQLTIGLQFGAHRDAHKALWMEHKCGTLKCKTQTMESLVQDATIHLDSDTKFSPEPGVPVTVPPAPSLRPTGASMVSGKARLVTDNAPTEDSKDSMQPDS